MLRFLNWLCDKDAAAGAVGTLLFLSFTAWREDRSIPAEELFALAVIMFGIATLFIVVRAIISARASR